MKNKGKARYVEKKRFVPVNIHIPYIKKYIKVMAGFSF